jgi:hypothetical protein
MWAPGKTMVALPLEAMTFSKQEITWNQDLISKNVNKY